MDRSSVVFWALIWILLQACVCVVRTQANTTDVTQDTTDIAIVTSFSGVSDIDVDIQDDSREDKICSWSVGGTEKGFRITWTGNASDQSEVVVDAMSADADCKYTRGSVKTFFSQKVIDLPACPNFQYEITIQLDCSTTGNSIQVWSPPEPPRGVVIKNVDNTSFAVSWSKPSGNGPIEAYNISVTDSGGFQLLQNSTDVKTMVSGLKPWTTYRVSVAAKNADFWGEYSDAEKVKTKAGIPPAPEKLRPTETGNTSISLQWDQPSVDMGPIEKYIVRWKNSSMSFEEHTVTNDTKYTVVYLVPYVQYTFTVSAKTEAGQGDWSDALMVRTSVGIPRVPENLHNTSVSNTSVSLRWNEPSISTGPILKYHVRWKNSSYEKRDVSPCGEFCTEFTVKGLWPYAEYAFSVSAETEAGLGPWYAEIKIRTEVGVPYAPIDLKNTSVTNTSASLEWNEPPVSTGPILHYRIHWRNENVERVKTTPNNITSNTVEDLTPYVLYVFCVSAVTRAGAGETSREINVQTDVGLPYAPIDLKNTSVTNTSVSLEWNEPPVSTGPILYYRILWRNENVDRVKNTPNNITSYMVEDLTPYVLYAFSVSAVTRAGAGKTSREINVQTDVGVPYPPINLEQSSITNTSVSLKWEEPPVSTGPITCYRVFWKNSSKSGSDDTSSNDTFHTVTNLTPFVKYTFSVSAVTKAGSGEPSDEVTIQTKVGVPYTPINLEQSSITNTSVSLKWEEPPVSTGPITCYRVFWKNSSKSGSDDTSSNDTFLTVTNLTPFVKYTFSVSAVTKAGSGEPSDEVTIQTKVGVPLAPMGLKMTTIGNTSVDIQWKEPGISRGVILRYRVYWKNSTQSGEEDTASNATSYKLERLAPYVSYAVKVLGLTSAGAGAWSEDVKFQTKVGVPHAPRNVAVSKMTNTSAEIKWSEPSPSTGPIDGYRVHWKNSSGEGEVDTKSQTTYYTVQHLTPYVAYTFRALALTSAGPGEWSKQVKNQTKVGVPHPVEKFTATHVGNTSVSVAWNVPNISTGPILRYRLWWKNSTSSGQEDTSSNATHHKLQRLTPYVYYKLKAQAITEAGAGSWSKELAVRTDIGIPHSPTHLTESNVTNTSVVLTWSEPTPVTGPIVSYTVRWISSRGQGFADTSERSLTVSKLLPYLNYTFAVSATTNAGQGQWSPDIVVQTDIGVPTIPTNLRATQVTNTSLTLNWNRPEFPNAPEMTYRLTYGLLLRNDVHPLSVIIVVPAHYESVSHEIQNLLPYTYYSIRLSASSPAGQSPVTAELINQTKVGVPLAAKILDVKAVTYKTALVRWIPDGPYPGPVDYVLETWKFPGLCSDSDKEYVAKEIKGSQKADEWTKEHPTSISGLTPFAVYRFRILLKTSATKEFIFSRKSEMVRIAPEAPSTPLGIKAVCIGSPTELKISWKPPREPNGIITSYRIEYGIQRKNSSRLVHVHNMCQSQSYVLTGLRPERRYLISVSARVENVSEDGAPAQPDEVCILPPGIPSLGDTSSLQAEGSGSESLQLVWTYDTFSDSMGEIVQYAVLVGTINALGNATRGEGMRVDPPWFNFSSGYSDFYQATPPGWNPFKDDSDPLACRISYEVLNDANKTVLRCTLGLNKNCPKNGTYCNGPLKPDTPYEMKIRAFTRGGFTDTDPILARSKPISKPNVGGKVAVVIVVLLLLVALAGGGYVMKKKGHLDVAIVRIRSHLNPKEDPPKQEEPPMQMEECNSPKPIKTKYFAEHVRIMMSDSHLKFSLEFEKLKNESPRLPCTVAEMEENRAKNRWMNIFPFDHSRVKLLPLCDEPGSDFINANYIPGYSSRREYIATQGPLPHVLDDFWRMVWEQSVNVIVMLTQCVERGKKKCEKYWPDSGDTQYHGDLRITTVSVSMLSSYIIRIFHVQSGSYERFVKQMHFTHWPDFGCPECPEDLINFVNATREHLPRVAPGPILVHCSAGVGRTGTFIAVDRLMLQLRHAINPGEDTVDVYGTVLDLRQHRTNMVQTEDQYIYIHLCVRQLIEDRDRPPMTGSQENIYSNLAIERDSSISVKPTAPDPHL